MLVVWLVAVVKAATREPDITEAVRTCERDVPAYCASNTCPQFCGTFVGTANKKRCSADCVATKRCAVKANVASQNIPGNEALDAQNREQLIRCIAQTRDPNFTKTGMTREDTPWRLVQTPSFKKAIQPPRSRRPS